MCLSEAVYKPLCIHVYMHNLLWIIHIHDISKHNVGSLQALVSDGLGALDKRPSTCQRWLNKLHIQSCATNEAFTLQREPNNAEFYICSEVPGTVTPPQKNRTEPKQHKLSEYISPVSTAPVPPLFLAVIWLCSNGSQGIYWFWLNVSNCCGSRFSFI